MRWSKADTCHSADFNIIEHINTYVLFAGIVLISVKPVGPETYQPFELNFPEVLASPTSSTNSISGPSGAEKRLPCEFCGRCFTNSLEWERHVLRHGMLVISLPFSFVIRSLACCMRLLTVCTQRASMVHFPCLSGLCANKKGLQVCGCLVKNFCRQSWRMWRQVYLFKMCCKGQFLVTVK